MREALIGCTLSVDPETVAEPADIDNYFVPPETVLSALHVARRIEAATDWDIVRPHLIRIPFHCAERITT